MNDETFIKKIDELGRIVIPKEIRNRLKFLPNESLSVTIKNDMVILNKCSLNKLVTQNILNLCNIFDEIYKEKYCIVVNDKKIYSNVIDDNVNMSKLEIIYNSYSYGYIEYVSYDGLDLKNLKLLSRVIAFLINIS